MIGAEPSHLGLSRSYPVIEKFIIRQPPKGEKDDYDNETPVQLVPSRNCRNSNSEEWPDYDEFCVNFTLRYPTQ